MTATKKLRVKIGDAEFEAEGSEESVKQDYAEFLGKLEELKKKPSTVNNAQNKIHLPIDLGEADPERVSRVFKVEDDMVSLTFLPRTENAQADALMLLLYGYLLLKEQQMVLGTQLTRAANQSGLGMDRVDRSLGQYEAENLVLKGGAKKGTRYGLNNQGKIRAQQILNALPL